MKKFLFLVFFSVFFFSYGNNLFAQEASIRQYPENPREGEAVTLTLSSDKYNLNLAEILWTVDGVVADNGVGRKTLTLKTSIQGLAQTVVATINQEGYNESQVQTVVEPNTNFVLYEGVDSYVPSFYKGRRIPTGEGVARIALFSFKEGQIAGFGNSSDTYIWKINGEEKKQISGINKIVNQILSRVVDNSLLVSIEKQESTGTTKITEENIPLAKTETIIYKTDVNKLTREPIKNIEVGKQIYLQIEPFFFSAANKKDSNLLYTWKLNDLESKISTPWSVTFSGKERDSVKINLSISNNKKITQSGESGFTFKVE